MKKIILFSGIIALSFVLSGCDKNLIDEPMDTLQLKSGKLTGFDQWGYNWNAHQFNGYLINAMFGDNMDESVPWFHKEPPYYGNLEEYQSDHPEVVDYPFWGFGNMTVVMHWNEALISSEGVYQYPWVDSNAWITFHYKMGEGKDKWSQFQKFVAVKSTDNLSGDGVWSDDEGNFIGYSYMWPDLALIQVVNTGNVPEGMWPTYKSPMSTGLGKYKSR